MQLFFKSLILLLLTSTSAYALTYPINGNTEVVGKVFSVKPQHMDTFSRYARIYDVGAYALMRANPGVNEDYPDKQANDIVIPASFVLPSKREGIVINLPELRLYHFMGSSVETYPISIGREGWRTPIRETTVVDKEKNPSWHVPKSIQAEAAGKGQHLPSVVGPGPKNPLGQYAMHLGMSGYMLHGTNTPTSIGRRVSHGCMRLFPADIEQLFYNVTVGTNVSIINEPVKAGWLNNKLYLQVYPSLNEYPLSESEQLALAQSTIDAAKGTKNTQIDWKVVEKLVKQRSGVPEVIG